MEEYPSKKTLAIIPCLNEEATIGSIVLKTKRQVDEVLVIDDGSIDETAKIAKEAGAKVITHNSNHGKSQGIKTGFNYALDQGFSYAITLDGDGQHNPDEIPTLLSHVMNGDDISIGIRSGNGTEMPKWRRIGKRVLDYATSFGNGGHIVDSQCGFRAFNQKAMSTLASRLNGDDFTVESEQIIKAHELGLKIGKTEVSCKYKNLDTSTKNPATHGFSVLRYVIWLVAEKRPMLFITLPGFILCLAGLFLGIRTLYYYNETKVFLLSYAILVSILLIIGFLAIFIGVMLNVLPHMIKRAREE